MFPVREFEKRFREILAELDELREEAADEVGEALEEMNAEYEDALFLIECINTEDDEWQDEFLDAMEEFEDLCRSYRKLSETLPSLSAEADRLDMAIRMAQSNLGQ